MLTFINFFPKFAWGFCHTFSLFIEVIKWGEYSSGYPSATGFGRLKWGGTNPKFI